MLKKMLLLAIPLISPTFLVSCVYTKNDKDSTVYLSREEKDSIDKLDELLSTHGSKLTARKILNYWNDVELVKKIVEKHLSSAERYYDVFIINMLASILGNHQKIEIKKYISPYLSYLTKQYYFTDSGRKINTNVLLGSRKQSLELFNLHLQKIQNAFLKSTIKDQDNNILKSISDIAFLNAYDNTINYDTFDPQIPSSGPSIIPAQYENNSKKRYYDYVTNIKRSWTNHEDYRFKTNGKLFKTTHFLRTNKPELFINQDKYILNLNVNKLNINNLRYKVYNSTHTGISCLIVSVYTNPKQALFFDEFLMHYNSPIKQQDFTEINIDITDEINKIGLNNIDLLFVNGYDGYNSWVNDILNDTVAKSSELWKYVKNEQNVGNKPILLWREGLDYSWDNQEEYKSIIAMMKRKNFKAGA
ncbi:hypothetical protein [Mycoplasma simbae]|uniref:hypothetical protein n=1 Tax=Mycoplasma simbae TaxID=36744 RepID=UPI000497813C|nr:hypothetical protein [Mycoplasma simbae]